MSSCVTAHIKNLITYKRKNHHGKYFLILVFAMFALSYGATHAAFADTVTATITVGKAPTGVGINTQTNKAYVANENNNTVSVVSLTTNTVMNTIGVGGRPLDVGVNAQTDKVYVANYNSGTVSVIDGTAGTVVATVQVGNNPVGIGVNPNTNKIYVSNYNSGTVSVIDGTSNNVINTITTAQGTSGIGVNTVTNKIYAVNAGPGTVSVIDGATGTVTATITVGSNPQFAAVNPATNKIYVTNNHSNTISVIDGSTNTVLSTIAVAAGPGGEGINTQTNKIYYSTNAGTLEVIDGATGSILASDATGEVQPDYIGVNSATNTVYASDLGSNVVKVISTSSSSPTPTVPSAPGSSMIFSDDYSSSAGWTQVGTEVYISNGHVVINGIDGSDHHIYKSLGATLSNTTAFALNFDFIFTAATNPADYIATLTDGTNSPDFVGNLLGAGLGINGNTLGMSYFNAQSMSSAQFSSSNIPLSLNTQYYITLERLSPTTAKLSAFYDSARTVQVAGSPIYQAIPSRLAGLSVIEHAVAQTGCTCRSLTGYVDNTGLVTGSLVATGVSPSQINLSWTVPSSNGGSPITNYKIYRSTSSGTETLLTETGNATSYSDIAVTSGQTYFYKVTAVNLIGESMPSNEVSATPAAPATSISISNVQSTSGTASAPGTALLSSNQITIPNFNAGTASNSLLVVGVSANNNSAASVTFRGAPLTSAASSFYNNDAELWYLKNPSGTGDIVVTMSGPAQAVVGAYSFSGVNQTDPIPTSVAAHNTAPGSPAISITTKYANDLVLDLPSIYGGSTLGSPTCMQQWNTNVPNGITGASSSSVTQSPAAVACNWTASSADLWDDVAIEIRASG